MSDCSIGFLNLRGVRALVGRSWMMWLQHRSFFWLLAFGWMIPPLIYLFVWSAAAADQTVGGMTQGEFVAYYLVLIFVIAAMKVSLDNEMVWNWLGTRR